MASLSILVGYLAGSVPFAFLLARRAGIDVRGRAAATSARPTCCGRPGSARAFAVMVLDVAKGAAAVGSRTPRRAGAASPR